MYKKSLKWEISESATFKLSLIEHCAQGDLLCLTRTCKQFELFIQYFTFSVFENNVVSLRNKVRLLQQLKNVNSTNKNGIADQYCCALLQNEVPLVR